MYTVTAPGSAKENKIRIQTV